MSVSILDTAVISAIQLVSFQLDLKPAADPLDKYSFLIAVGDKVRSVYRA